MSDPELIVRMDRVVCAVRGLLYARDNSPGDPFGHARADCLTEMRAALAALDKYQGDAQFDVKAYLEELERMRPSAGNQRSTG